MSVLGSTLITTELKHRTLLVFINLACSRQNNGGSSRKLTKRMSHRMYNSLNTEIVTIKSNAIITII